MTANDNEGNKGKVTNIRKVTIYCRIFYKGANVKFVVGVARCLMWVADVG